MALVMENDNEERILEYDLQDLTPNLFFPYAVSHVLKVFVFCEDLGNLADDDSALVSEDACRELFGA